MLAKRISRNTAAYKLLMVVFWIVFGVAVLGVGFFALPPGPRLPFLLGPSFVWLLAIVLYRKLVGDVVDEVWDCGDHLLVKRGDQQSTVPFANIMNVSATVMVNPPRITLRLVQPGPFGSEIAFLTPSQFSLNPFVRNLLADDLIERAHRARVRG